MNIHIEMDQGVKKLGPHYFNLKFLILEILGRYYEGQFFSFRNYFLYKNSLNQVTELI